MGQLPTGAGAGCLAYRSSPLMLKPSRVLAADAQPPPFSPWQTPGYPQPVCVLTPTLPSLWIDEQVLLHQDTVI